MGTYFCLCISRVIDCNSLKLRGGGGGSMGRFSFSCVRLDIPVSELALAIVYIHQMKTITLLQIDSFDAIYFICYRYFPSLWLQFQSNCSKWYCKYLSCQLEENRLIEQRIQWYFLQLGWSERLRLFFFLGADNFESKGNRSIDGGKVSERRFLPKIFFSVATLSSDSGKTERRMGSAGGYLRAKGHAQPSKGDQYLLSLNPQTRLVIFLTFFHGLFFIPSFKQLHPHPPLTIVSCIIYIPDYPWIKCEQNFLESTPCIPSNVCNERKKLVRRKQPITEVSFC